MVLDATTNPCQWEKLQKTHLRGGSITEYTHIKKKSNQLTKKTTHTKQMHKILKQSNKQNPQNPSRQTNPNKQTNKKTQIKPKQATKKPQPA